MRIPIHMYTCRFIGGDLQVVLVCKELVCQYRRQKRCRFNPWVGKILWREAWQSTPVFLPGEFYERRNLVGYSIGSQSQTRLRQLSTSMHIDIYRYNFHIIFIIISYGQGFITLSFDMCCSPQIHLLATIGSLLQSILFPVRLIFLIYGLQSITTHSEEIFLIIQKIQENIFVLKIFHNLMLNWLSICMVRYTLNYFLYFGRLVQ